MGGEAKRAPEFSGAAVREAGAWIGSLYSCAVVIGGDAGSTLSGRSVYADAVENKVTGTRRPAESVSLLFLNFPQALHLLGKPPSTESRRSGWPAPVRPPLLYGLLSPGLAWESRGGLAFGQARPP